MVKISLVLMCLTGLAAIYFIVFDEVYVTACICLLVSLSFGLVAAIDLIIDVRKEVRDIKREMIEFRASINTKSGKLLNKANN